ncbi:4'-phosphopantetheinyl transferase family protein [Phyllobacterium myrsinacearum]|uniref:4'-phosphopantetheinyl transferase n=1 Tax=Phyllobacterium myrsinacearum TaxID=28101 RepID=A0A839EHC0_9HYPH|nr:4'-phosphopantetheinyl transferase superfamily protein [Phyllobacterium myrsinacearum]MBA8879381.1 4'-phosphopantetheinyl transferase [Phyllobacterium myrsinacearum]
MLPYGLLLDLPKASATAIGEHQPAVDIWWWDYRSGKTDWNKVKSTLTLPEQDRAASFRFDTDAIGFMAGRYLQRSVLSSYLGGIAEGLNIVTGEHGKPYLVGETALAFNLSNTNGLAVLGVSRDCSAVGVDAETRSTAIETGTSQLICSAAESATLSMLRGPERQSLLLAYWTLKESFLKATGHGLTVEPHRLNVQVDTVSREIRVEHDLSCDRVNWHHRLFRSPEGHMIAVSVQSNRAGLVFRQHSLPDSAF